MSDGDASQWTERTLYSLAKYLNGRAFKPAETIGTAGVPVIKIAELNSGITGRTGWFSGPVEGKHSIEEGDLLFAWSGSIGVYRYDGPPGVLNQHIFKCIAEPSVDQVFLRYLLEGQLAAFNGIVEDMRTTMGHVKIADLKRMTVMLPPLAEQRRIGELFAVLDEVIASRERLIRLVDAAVSAAGAVSLETSEEIHHSQLTDLVTVTNGYSYKSAELVDLSTTALVNLKNFGRHGGFRRDGLKPFRGQPKPAQRLSVGDVLVAKTDLTQEAEVVGRCLRMPRLTEFDEYVASLDAAILRPSGSVSSEALLALLNQSDFRDHCLGYANGTTVLHLSKEAIPAFVVSLPDEPRMQELEERVIALTEEQDQAFADIQVLRSVRSFISRKVLVGDLSVDAAEELVEDVA